MDAQIRDIDYALSQARGNPSRAHWVFVIVLGSEKGDGRGKVEEDFLTQAMHPLLVKWQVDAYIGSHPSPYPTGHSRWERAED